MKFLTSVLLIYTMLLVTACPQDSAVRKAAKASFELSGITLDVVNATAKAYDAGIISLAVKDKMAAAEKQIAAGGAHFNSLLEGYIKQYPNGVIPSDKLGLLNSIFSGDIVTPFLQILEQIKVLNPTQAGYLSAAISTLRTALLVIAGVFADAGMPDMRFTLASA